MPKLNVEFEEHLICWVKMLTAKSAAKQPIFQLCWYEISMMLCQIMSNLLYPAWIAHTYNSEETSMMLLTSSC
jgi:hypothetical protein